MRIIILLFLGASLFFSKNKNDDQFVKKCLQPTVSVINKKNKTTGTAFVVKSERLNNNLYCNIAISCEHVTANKLYISIHEYTDTYFHAGESLVPALTLAKNKDNDVSILMFLTKNKMPTSNMKFDKNLKLRQKVFTVGCGLGDSPRFSEGYITELTPSKNNLKNIRTSVCVVPGDSGSALFTEDYEVIGIANYIKAMTNNQDKFPVTNISNFKSIQLIEKLFKNEKFDFVFSSSKCPDFINDYLWLCDAEYGF